MNRNMNTTPVLPNENVGEASGSAGGWSQLESGLIVPGRLAQEVGGMTREKRIADGQERVDALKSRAKDGLGKMMQGLKDYFYISVSRGAELSGRLAEKGAEAKEVAGNTYAAAKEKASELFNKGRDFIAQKAEESRQRKAARLAKRQERKKSQQVTRQELDRRQAERADRKESRQRAEGYRTEQDIAAKADDRKDKELVERTQEEVAEVRHKYNEAREQLTEAREEERAARIAAEKAVKEAKLAEFEVGLDPENKELQFVAQEKVAMSLLADVELGRASHRVQGLKDTALQLSGEISKDTLTLNDTQGRMQLRLAQAERRKDERAKARREARGDIGEAVRDRIDRVINAVTFGRRAQRTAAPDFIGGLGFNRGIIGVPQPPTPPQVPQVESRTNNQ